MLVDLRSCRVKSVRLDDKTTRNEMLWVWSRMPHEDARLTSDALSKKWRQWLPRLRDMATAMKFVNARFYSLVFLDEVNGKITICCTGKTLSFSSAVCGTCLHKRSFHERSGLPCRLLSPDKLKSWLFVDTLFRHSFFVIILFSMRHVS